MRLLDCPFSLTEKSGRQWIESVELDEDGRELIDSDLRLFDALQEEIDFLDRKLAQRVWQDDRVKLLMTIPGISQNVAQSVVAAVGDIERFESPEKLASYFGLVPSTRQSASRCYHGSITKAGRSEARWTLVQAAHACARCDLAPLGHFFTKVKRRKSYNSAIVALARKLAMLCWHLLKTGKPYRYAKPQSVEMKLQRLRVLGSGVRRRGTFRALKQRGFARRFVFAEEDASRTLGFEKAQGLVAAARTKLGTQDPLAHLSKSTEKNLGF